MAQPPRIRLDQLLSERGLVVSRERARALILAGRVEVEGRRVDKAGAAVDPNAAVRLIEPDHPYVSRGGVKLAHALLTFGIDARGRRALDIGASTGGFTDALLQAGAAHVVAVDVGHNQLAWRLRDDPRVTAIEGLNARHLSSGDLPPAHRRFDIVVIDVAFISVRHILPVVPPLLAEDGVVIVLVKPQFEARRAEVGRGGIVRDTSVRARVVDEVATIALDLGFEVHGRIPSPITGADGNEEFLLHLRRPVAHASDGPRLA